MEDLRPEKTALTVQAPEKRRFSYSIASIGIFAALLTFLIAVGALGFISFYYQEQLRRQYLDYTVRIQTQINTDTAANFQTLERQLFMLGISDSDISLINTTQDSQTFYRAKMAIYDELSNLWPPYPDIDGLFFYSSSAGRLYALCGAFGLHRMLCSYKKFADARKSAFWRTRRYL